MSERLAFLVSRLDSRAVDDSVLQAADRLLDATGPDGPECLVDAVVAATAALSAPPVRLVTSARSHIPKLCTAAPDLPGQPSIGVIAV